MKTVFGNSELVHVWAAQKQDTGRTCTNSMFFSDGTIYSYGHHFPIARHHNGVVLFTTRTYSKSTAKHIALVRYACSHLNRIHVDSVFGTAEENALTANKEIENLLKKAATARANRVSYLNQAHSVLDNLQKLHTLLNEGTSAGPYLRAITDKLAHLDLNEVLVSVKQQRAEEKEKAKAKAARLLIDQTDRVEKWLNGTGHHYPQNLPVALRIKDGNVETSKGAKVSVGSARVLLSMIDKNADIVGHVVDGYTVISKNKVLKIGCHDIPLSEVERLKTLIREV